jgi:surface carbohydrate biosynthesis protein (TIGR04326 family)|tara:strand:- start:10322 stop:12193 length:1872 start_codon:yes stop_codon:yes gene_type:complete
VKKHRSLLIWDCEGSPSEDCGFTVYWQSHTPSDRGVSIPQLVEENASQFRAQYLALIFDLGEAKVEGKRIVEHLKINQEFSHWWMTLITEKCNYSKSPQIDNIIKFQAFRYWLNNIECKTIQLVSANKKFAQSMRLLSVELSIGFEWKEEVASKVTDSFFRRTYNHLPDYFKAVLFLSKHLLGRWKLKGVGIEKWKNSTAMISFISYFFNLDSDVSAKGEYRSGYWNVLSDELLDNNIQTNWLHLYYKSDLFPTISSAKEMINTLNKRYHDYQNHLFPESFLSFTIVRETVVYWLKVVVQYGKVKQCLKEKSGYLWPLLEKDLSVSLRGTIAIENLLFFCLFSEAMKVLPKQKIGVYLQENQGWEFGFIDSWKQSKHGKLIAVPHSTVRFWDLRYYFDHRAYQENNSLQNLLPDKVAVNGEIAKKNKLDSGYPCSKLVEVEALRYLQLEQSYKNNTQSSNIKSSNTVLVLGDYQHSNTDLQMKLLQKASKLVEDSKIKYVIKPHPAHVLLDTNYPEPNMRITNRPVPELIEQCCICYTSSTTSAAVDAYCAGMPVISVLNPKSLNLSPLRGCEGVSFVSTADDLALLLNNIDTIKAVDSQGDEYFYLDKKLPRWKKLLLNGIK